MKHLNRIAAAVAFIATTFLFSACGGESFTDPRDGQKYKTVKIGDQVWMAEKLKYKGNDSYSWDKALVACPEGWRLPNKKDASTLINKLSKYCKEREPYKHALEDCSVVREFWGQKMGCFDDESQFKNGTGIMIIGYWLLSDGYYLENHVDLSIERISSWMKKMNVRCIADTEDKKEE